MRSVREAEAGGFAAAGLEPDEGVHNNDLADVDRLWVADIPYIRLRAG